MAELLKCIECQKPVSSSLNSCPHCSTKFIKGVECQVCGQILKESESYKKFGGSYERGNASWFTYYHKSCWNTITAVPKHDKNKEVFGNCSVCHTPYVKECDGTYYLNCSNCGQHITVQYEDPYVLCHFCSNKLLREQSITVSLRNKTLYSHTICYTKEKQLSVAESNKSYYAEQIREEKEKRERNRRNQNYVYWNGERTQGGRSEGGIGCGIIMISIFCIIGGLAGHTIALVIGILGIISTIYHLIE